MHTLRNALGDVSSVEFSPDWKRVASVKYDFEDSIIIWNVETAAQVCETHR